MQYIFWKEWWQKSAILIEMMINNTQQKCQDICIFWLKKKKKDINLNWNILFFNNAK